MTFELRFDTFTETQSNMERSRFSALLFVLLLIVVSDLSAQKRTKKEIIDSLFRAEGAAKEDTNKVLIYEKLCWELKNTGRYSEAVIYGLKGVALAEKLKFNQGLAASCNSLGVAFYRKASFDSAEMYLQRAVEINKQIGDTSDMAMNMNNLGLVKRDQGDYPMALEYMFESLRLKEALNDTDGVASAYGNIGIVYNGLDQPDTSLLYFEKALKLSQLIGNERDIAFSYNNMGAIYHKQKKYDLALSSFQKALEIKLRLNEKRGIAGSRANIGAVYQELGQFDKAIPEFDSALVILTASGDRDGIASCNNLKGLALFKAGRTDEAFECFTMAYDLAVQIGSTPEVKTACEGLAMVYEKRKDWANAYKYYKQFAELNDSLRSDEKTRQALTAKLRYDYEKREALAKAEEMAREQLREEESRRQQLYVWFASGAVLLVLLLALFIYRGYRTKKKANEELDDKNRKIENAYQIIEHKNKEITDSINYAKRIQSAILPEAELISKHLPESFVYYMPKDIVAGDFYYFEEGQSGSVFIGAADCTGHGVPGAFMSLICARELHLANNMTGSPAKMLTLVNRAVRDTLRQNHLEGGRDGMDIALLRISGKQVVYSGANRPLWRFSASGNFEEIKPTKHGIGGYTEEDVKFEEHTLECSSGDMIYIFSDGYADQFGGDKGKKLTTKRFREFLMQIRDLSCEKQHQALSQYLNDWKGSVEQIDDLLVIGFRVL